MRWFLPKNHDFLELFDQASANVVRGATLFTEILRDPRDRDAKVEQLKEIEHEGDRITHDIIHRLNGNGHGRPPIHDADVYELARALDDIVDFAEQAADQLGLYGVEATMEQAVALSDVLVGTGEEVAEALRALRTGSDLSPHLVEIHRLENEGDTVVRAAIAKLFEQVQDPIEVIKWKEIYEHLETAIDKCEDAANIIEQVVLKNA